MDGGTFPRGTNDMGIKETRKRRAKLLWILISVLVAALIISVLIIGLPRAPVPPLVVGVETFAPYDACPPSIADPSIDVPISVNDKSNSIARDPNDGSSFMVPFARTTNLMSVNPLVVVDASGNRLPAQFETLSRWGGAPD